MANIITFKCPETSKKGIRIGMLPMPNCTYRAYKEYGRDALKIILKRWRQDCEEMIGGHA